MSRRGDAVHIRVDAVDAAQVGHGHALIRRHISLLNTFQVSAMRPWTAAGGCRSCGGERMEQQERPRGGDPVVGEVLAEAGSAAPLRVPPLLIHGKIDTANRSQQS